jgi:ATPase subunit of ABC transporter with duplicated ATPase domains
MASEAEKTRKLDFEEIQIPMGPRLGNVVVEVEHLKKGFGDRLLIDDLSFTLPRNGIVGVIGPNGAGKTTLFKTILGMEQPDSGTVKIGETVKISYVDQSRGGILFCLVRYRRLARSLDHDTRSRCRLLLRGGFQHADLTGSGSHLGHRDRICTLRDFFLAAIRPLSISKNRIKSLVGI